MKGSSKSTGAVILSLYIYIYKHYFSLFDSYYLFTLSLYIELHMYSLEDYGLTKEMVRNEFKDYVSRFDIAERAN